jgi:hypothetical protein
MLSKETAIAFPLAASSTAFITSNGQIRPRSVIVRRLVTLIMLIAGYCIYRFTVLGGIGGYTTSLKTFSLQAVLGYAVVDIWPASKWSQDMNWQTFFLSCATAIPILLSNNYTTKSLKGSISVTVPLLLLFLILLSFCATLPLSARMVFERSESRISYMHIFILAILIGAVLNTITSQKGIFFCRILALVVLLPAIGLHQKEIKEWEKAGKIAGDILVQTKQLSPNPPLN